LNRRAFTGKASWSRRQGAKRWSIAGLCRQPYVWVSLQWGGGLADSAHAGELAERVEEFRKGAGFGKVGSVSTGEGVAAVAVD